MVWMVAARVENPVQSLNPKLLSGLAENLVVPSETRCAADATSINGDAVKLITAETSRFSPVNNPHPCSL